MKPRLLYSEPFGTSTLLKNSRIVLGGLLKSYSAFSPWLLQPLEGLFWPCVSEEAIRCSCELPWQPDTFFLFNDTFRLAYISAKYRLLRGGNGFQSGQPEPGGQIESTT